MFINKVLLYVYTSGIFKMLRERKESLQIRKKERLEMKKELSILRSKDSGDLTLGYAGIDLKDYDYITVAEYISIVEGLDSWDMVDAEIYERALENVDLDYNDYDDPNIMWNDFLKAVNNEYRKVRKWKKVYKELA